MEITSTSVLYGSNSYADRGVVRHLVSLNAEDKNQEKLIDIRKLTALNECLPDLQTSLCDDEIAINHLFEHICIELQNISGTRLNCECVECRTGLSTQDIVYPYEDEEIGLKCADLALDLINNVVFTKSSTDVSTEATDTEFNFKERLDAFLDFSSRLSIRVQDRAVLEEAVARNIPVTRQADRLFQLGYGKFQKRLSATKTSHTNVISNDIAANKDYSRRILSELGLPAPEYKRVRNIREAVEAAEHIGYPVVVKPNNGGMGRGVSIGLRSSKAVREAYKLARKWGRSCLVEQYVPGSDFRMLVINGRLIAASHRVPAHVRGDGEHTILELVDKTNSDPRRGPGQELPWTHLQLDEKADQLLAELGYTHQSIPSNNEVVYLRRNANTSDGGTAADITDDVHPDNRDIAVRAVSAIGLDIAGVDLLTTDISQSMWDTKGCICEINSRPGIRKHMWPAEGKPRDVTGPLIDMLFPAGSNGRIPIIAITGSGHTQTCARMLAHILTLNGHTVGLSTRHGVSVGNYKHRDLSTTGVEATRRILLDPSADIAVLEINPAEVIRKGLGFDSCAVCAIINLEQTEAELSESSHAKLWNKVIKVVTKATQGKTVISGNDTISRNVTEARKPEDLCMVSLNTTSTTDRDLVNNSGGYISLEKTPASEYISIYDQAGDVVRIPVEGAFSKLKESSTGNRDMLFAAALASNVGVNPDVILKGLTSFDSANI